MADVSERTIRHHVKQGWLKPIPKHPGIRGYRITQEEASRWIGLHYPMQTLR